MRYHMVRHCVVIRITGLQLSCSFIVENNLELLMVYERDSISFGQEGLVAGS